MSRLRRRVLPTAAAAIVLLAAAGILAAVGGNDSTAGAEEEPTAATAEVLRQDMARTDDVDGELSYGDVHTLTGTLPGTVTWLPETGTVLEPGDAVYDVDNQPVTAMHGVLPMWRNLTDGVEGPDVLQLEENLADLGYDGFTVDDTYTDVTADAVESWQEDNGMDETGVVALGQVVFLPSAMRVAEQTASIGDQANGPVLGYTVNRRTVTLELEISDQDLVEEELPVTVTLPDDATVDGEVAAISTTVSGSASEGAEQSEDEPATIEVTVAIDDQDALGDLEAAPVTVELTSEVHEAVLAVPVEALVALREGGYGLEIVEDGESTLISVATGIFARGLVEVDGEGLAEGMRVGVPS